MNGSTQLPDRVYGSADLGNHGRELSVSAGDKLLHAHIGGMYLAMSEANWRILFAALSELEVGVGPRTYRIVFDDDNSEATVEVTA